MNEHQPGPDACTCGHLAADHAFQFPFNCRKCACEGFEAAVPLEDGPGGVLFGPFALDEPVPYLPVVPLVHLHVFASNDVGWLLCRCGITLGEWQQQAYARLADAALGEEVPDNRKCAAPGPLVGSWCIHPFDVPHMHEDEQGRKWGPGGPVCIGVREFDAAYDRGTAHIALDEGAGAAMSETATGSDGVVHKLGTQNTTVCGQQATSWSRAVTPLQLAGLVLFCEACHE